MDLIPGATRIGFRSDGDGGGTSWATFPASLTDEQILEAWACPAHYSGPGQSFAHEPFIHRRTATRVLVTQFSGLDI